MAADAAFWKKDVALEYRKILLAGAEERVEERVEQSGAMKRVLRRKGLSKERLDEEKQRLLEAKEKRMAELPFGRMLRCRVRYFTDGAVIGSREFVNAAFASAHERSRPKRKDGARRMRGSGKPTAGLLWSVRDLRVEIGKFRSTLRWQTGQGSPPKKRGSWRERCRIMQILGGGFRGEGRNNSSTLMRARRRSRPRKSKAPIQGETARRSVAGSAAKMKPFSL